MTSSIPDVLARIVEHKRQDLPEIQNNLARFEAQAAARSDFRDFAAAVTANPPAIIAEAKKASPSKGLLSSGFDPAAIAKKYEEGSAAAMSVLTDQHFFQGSLADLQAARAAVSIPVLRKDFTLDPIHVWEAAANGADAILLIAAILSAQEMRNLRELAESLHMAALVEVHNHAELGAALESGARILGVNNRNLHTFEVKLETSLDLASRIPTTITKVSESGIFSGSDVQRLVGAGYQAFLVGEHLMKSPDPAAALQKLRQPA